jgi:hypothetical protein
MVIKAHKLLNGVDVVSEVEGQEWVNPMLAKVAMAGEGDKKQVSMSLHPMLPMLEGSNCSPNYDHVLVSYDPKDSVKALYKRVLVDNQVKSAGIVAPTQAQVNQVAK